MRRDGIIRFTNFGCRIRYPSDEVDRLANEGWTWPDREEARITGSNKPVTATGTSTSEIPPEVLAGAAVLRAQETAERLKKNSHARS